jgi:transposase
MDIKIGTPLRLGHLPILMDYLRKTKIFDVIDHAIREDPRSKVSTSECVAVILCSVYAGAHDLWRTRERLSRYDMKTIMQDDLFDINEFPEERLAKAMDDLHRNNLDKLMTSVALQTIEQFRLRTDFLSFDTTSLSFYGAYESEEFGSVSTDMPPVPLVTYGHSKNHRADLKQILYGTLMTADGGIPLMGKALDGNRSDSLSAAEFFANVRKLVADPRKVVCVADSKGWCARVVDLAQSEGLRLLSLLPKTHGIHAEIMAKPWKPTGRLEIPSRKKKGLIDVYEFMSIDTEEQFTLITQVPSPETSGVIKKIFTVKVRAIRIHSSALLRTKIKSLERLKLKEARLAIKKIGKLQNLAYACETDAQRAGERSCADHGWATIDLIATLIQVKGPMKRRRGRPSKNPETSINTDHYRITYETHPVKKKIITQRLSDQSTFILIRTKNAKWDIDDADLIHRYKGQFRNEHGFAWLKSGASLNPIFLHTPERIASLCFIYCIGLMAWNLIQRQVRNTLVKTNKMLPYHRGKPSNRITTRFLFELFAQVQVVPFSVGAEQEKRSTAGLDTICLDACSALGTSPAVFEPVN